MEETVINKKKDNSIQMCVRRIKRKNENLEKKDISNVNETIDHIDNGVICKDDKRTTSLMDTPLFKAIIFILLTIQSVLILLVLRLIKIKNIKYKLKNEQIICLTEIVKFFCSFLFFFHENHFNIKKAFYNVINILTKQITTIFLLLIPSVLYYVQNVCFFISLLNISSSVVQLVYQFRIFFVVLFSYLMLNKKFTKLQLLSIVFIIYSLVCLKNYNIEEEANNLGTKKFSNEKKIRHCNNPQLLNYVYKKNVTKNPSYHLYCSSGYKGNSQNLLLPCLIKWKYFKRDHVGNPTKKTKRNSNRNANTNIKKSMNQLEIRYKHENEIKTNEVDEFLCRKQVQYKYHTDTSEVFQKKYKLLGVTATLIATFTSGFSNVFLQLIYKNNHFSFWFQNMCLSFYSILMSLLMRNISLSHILQRVVYNKKKEKKTFQQIENEKGNILHTHEVLDNSKLYEETNGSPHNNSSLVFLTFRRYFFHYFNSFNEFLFICIIVLLNSIGGLFVAILIKCSNSILRFFITPISLLINVYISIVFFKDLSFSVHFFIALVCVFISLFLYCSDQFTLNHYKQKVL